MELDLQTGALVGNIERVLYGFPGNVIQSGQHFFFRFIVKICGVEFKSARISDLGLASDAQKHVVCFIIICIQIVTVIGSNQGKLGGIGKQKDFFIDLVLLRQVVCLHFKIETSGEQLGIFVGEPQRIIEIAAAWYHPVITAQCTRYLSCNACRQSNESICMPAQHFFVYPGLVVETFQIAEAHKAQQVGVASAVTCQEDKMMSCLCKFACLVFVIFGDIYFAAEDWGNTVVLARRIKVRGAEQIAVVGDGCRRHAERRGFFNELADLDGTVKQAEFCVAMQMHEIGHERLPAEYVALLQTWRGIWKNTFA